MPPLKNKVMIFGRVQNSIQITDQNRSLEPKQIAVPGKFRPYPQILVYDHFSFGHDAASRSKMLASLIRRKQIGCAGNRKLKIYGTLGCASGKRMKVKNRVFFRTEYEAAAAGYRPCGHCMKEAYEKWKTDQKLFT